MFNKAAWEKPTKQNKKTHLNTIVTNTTMWTTWWSVKLASVTPLHTHCDTININILVQWNSKIILLISCCYICCGRKTKVLWKYTPSQKIWAIWCFTYDFRKQVINPNWELNEGLVWTKAFNLQNIAKAILVNQGFLRMDGWMDAVISSWELAIIVSHYNEDSQLLTQQEWETSFCLWVVK